MAGLVRSRKLCMTCRASMSVCQCELLAHRRCYRTTRQDHESFVPSRFLDDQGLGTKQTLI